MCHTIPYQTIYRDWAYMVKTKGRGQLERRRGGGENKSIFYMHIIPSLSYPAQSLPAHHHYIALYPIFVHSDLASRFDLSLQDVFEHILILRTNTELVHAVARGSNSNSNSNSPHGNSNGNGIGSSHGQGHGHGNGNQNRQ